MYSDYSSFLVQVHIFLFLVYFLNIYSYDIFLWYLKILMNTYNVFRKCLSKFSKLVNIFQIIRWIGKPLSLSLATIPAGFSWLVHPFCYPHRRYTATITDRSCCLAVLQWGVPMFFSFPFLFFLFWWISSTKFLWTGTWKIILVLCLKCVPYPSSVN